MDKVVKTVMTKLMKGRYDTLIFDQLVRLQDESKSVKETYVMGYPTSFKEYCPFIKKDYSKKELKELKKLLSETIVKQLQKDNTFLQTCRLIEALECLGDLRKLPQDTNKLKFVWKFIISSQNHYQHLRPVFKDISLLDKI